MVMQPQQFVLQHHPAIPYLDKMMEPTCGIFRAQQPLPAQLAFSLSHGLAVDFDVLGNDNYNRRQYPQAQIWFSRELKVLWIVDGVSENDPFQVSSPLRAVAHYNRANTRDELHLYAEALEDYECSIELHKQAPWEIYNNRAIVYEKLKRIEEAKQDLEMAIALAPPGPQKEKYQASLARLSGRKGWRPW